MTYRGIKPRVRLVREQYQKGIRLTKAVMKNIEQKIDRLKGLEAWFITIEPEHVLG
jgi:hypothetical protein